MEYRGVQYALVLTPHGWRWSVKRGQNEVTATCPDGLAPNVPFP
jgi:hypothetical protein